VIDLKNKVAIITGASRGVGKACALKLAAEGVKVVVAAKTVVSHERTPGTIHDTVAEIKALGSDALAVQTNVRFEEQIVHLVQQTMQAFGRIDIVINNAGAIMFMPVEEMPVKRFDLMMQLNYRAPFILCHEAIPHMKKNQSGAIINMSPPTQLGSLAAEQWSGRTCYLMSKFGMSNLTCGLAEELKSDNISVNSLWPENIIDTQATRVFAKMLAASSTISWYRPELVAEAVLYVIKSEDAALTGQTLIAEKVLYNHGVNDLSHYLVNQGA